jgi:hypothetical protein
MWHGDRKGVSVWPDASASWWIENRRKMFKGTDSLSDRASMRGSLGGALVTQLIEGHKTLSAGFCAMWIFPHPKEGV